MNLLRLFGCYLNKYLPLCLLTRHSHTSANFPLVISISLSHFASRRKIIQHIFFALIYSVIVRSGKTNRITNFLFLLVVRRVAEASLGILETSPEALWQNWYAPNVFICFIVMPLPSCQRHRQNTTPTLNHSFLKRTNIGYWCYQRLISQFETIPKRFNSKITFWLDLHKDNIKILLR